MLQGKLKGVNTDLKAQNKTAGNAVFKPKNLNNRKEKCIDKPCLSIRCNIRSYFIFMSNKFKNISEFRA